MRTNRSQKEKDRKKKQKTFEVQLFKTIEKILEDVMKKSINEILKDLEK